MILRVIAETARPVGSSRTIATRNRIADKLHLQLTLFRSIQQTRTARHHKAPYHRTLLIALYSIRDAYTVGALAKRISHRQQRIILSVMKSAGHTAVNLDHKIAAATARKHIQATPLKRKQSRNTRIIERHTAIIGNISTTHISNVGRISSKLYILLSASIPA